MKTKIIKLHWYSAIFIIAFWLIILIVKANPYSNNSAIGIASFIFGIIIWWIIYIGLRIEIVEE